MKLYDWVLSNLWLYLLMCGILALMCLGQLYLAEYPQISQMTTSGTVRDNAQTETQLTRAMVTGLPLVQRVVAKLLSVTLALLVMLAVMTYDRGFFIAAVIGYGLGPFTLNSLTSTSMSAHPYVQMVPHS